MKSLAGCVPALNSIVRVTRKMGNREAFVETSKRWLPFLFLCPCSLIAQVLIVLARGKCVHLPNQTHVSRRVRPFRDSVRARIEFCSGISRLEEITGIEHCPPHGKVLLIPE